MKFSVTDKKTNNTPSDCLVVFTGVEKKGGYQLFPYGNTVDINSSSLLSKFASGQEFEGKVGKILRVYVKEVRLGVNNILLVGIGDVKKLTMKDWLDVMATVGREVKKMHAPTVSILLENEITDVLGGEKTAEGIVEGITLGTYAFIRYKKPEKKEHEIASVTIISEEEQQKLKKGIWVGELLSRATILARDLVNEPSSVTTPTFLSLVARDIANKYSAIACDVLEKKDMQKLGMGGILGIAKGSDEDPKLIKLTYKGRGNKTIILIGKGVTFDSGGLSLKSQEGMETMKIDMAGAASILGIFSVLSELKPNATVIGLIPAVENMPSGKAIKPGDIVCAYNGKTIEVISTDAEGRVILADALAYAGATMKPDIMIDLATLTGACMIALGEDIAGLFTTDKQLGDHLLQSSEHSGEALWKLPLPQLYNELIKSDIADIRNVSKKRYGGAITAALFLKAFVPDGIPWAHLDIAGPAVAEKDAPLTPVGGTGFGVRPILEYLLHS